MTSGEVTLVVMLLGDVKGKTLVEMQGYSLWLKQGFPILCGHGEGTDFVYLEFLNSFYNC